MSDARPHLLIVDDEPSIREPLATYLTKEGYRVTQAAGGEAARAALAASVIDLVVLDIMMPGEDGFSLCRHIRATGELPVILLTARTDDTDRIALWDAATRVGACGDWLLAPRVEAAWMSGRRLATLIGTGA